ncbi:MAG: hypothetical protein J0626_02795, partial [Rhodospirillaceae bacterium]|nr:hypothetical protein [Rhodospirillaceae bacterium]
DHYTSTSGRSAEDIADPQHRRLVEQIRDNSRASGVKLFYLGDERQGIAAELLESPAFQDRQTIASAGGEQFEFVGPRQQTRCHARFSRTDLEQQLEKICDQCSVLAQARRAIFTDWHFGCGQ